MGGGVTAMIAPSLIPAKRSFTAAVSASADCDLSRTDQSFRVGKASAAFSPLPEKLKPITRKDEATASREARNFSSSWPVTSARARVAPGGSWMSTIM